MTTYCATVAAPKRSAGSGAAERLAGRRGIFGWATVAIALLLPAALFCFQKPETAPGANLQDARPLLASAQRALNRGDYAAAVTALQALVRAEPDFAPAWFNLGYAYAELHQSDRAMEAYQKTIALNPDLFEGQINLGELLLRQHRAPEALPHLEKAVALRPASALAHLHYGRALEEAHRPHEAENEWREALRLDPHLAAAHYELGELELSRRDFVHAQAEFMSAAGLDPKVPSAELGLALACQGLGDRAGAALHFERYLAARPADNQVRLRFAALYLESAQPQKAIAELHQIEQTSPNYPGVAAALGDAYALARKFPDSERFYRQALVAAPGDARLHRALAQTLLEGAKTAEAESEFRAALKLDPANSDAQKGLASALYLEKRYADAVPLIERLIRQKNAPYGLLFVVATCYDHLGAKAQALNAYERYLQVAHGENFDQEWQARQRVKLLRRELRK